MKRFFFTFAIALAGLTMLRAQSPYAHYYENLPVDSEGEWVIKIHQYSDIENILSELRHHQVVIKDLQVQEPDLEDVFLQMMDVQKN